MRGEASVKNKKEKETIEKRKKSKKKKDDRKEKKLRRRAIKRPIRVMKAAFYGAGTRR